MAGLSIDMYVMYLIRKKYQAIQLPSISFQDKYRPPFLHAYVAWLSMLVHVYIRST